MFWNHIKVALRNIRKNKVYAAINIFGLALGLTIYVFGGLLTSYEQTHDTMFQNSERTYTVGVIVAPELNLGLESLNAVQSALGPILKAESPDIEAVARTQIREYLLDFGDEGFYETITFTDPEFLEIFDFDYISGDSRALEDPFGLVITETTAIKYFGTTDAVGQVVTFDNEFDFHIAAVIEDIPLNTHFNSNIATETGITIIAPIQGLSRMRDWDIQGEWDNLSFGNMTYVLLPEGFDQAWLEAQLDSIFERLVPKESKEVIAALTASPLVHANLSIWDTMGLPLVSVVSLLSFLVLIVACVNYTNLATAQSLGRSREVGMRKTMGASQTQLLTQFLVESFVIAAIAMVFAIAILEIIIPLFNNAANKNVSINYLTTLPWLLLTTLMVGLLAGLYPAWLITRASPIDALRDIARKGKKGGTMRSVMIGVQFAISVFMLSIVAIVYMQNQHIKDASYEFPKDNIYTIGRLGIDSIQGRLEALRNELEAIPNVSSVAYSWQVPFQQSNSNRNVAMQPGDEAGKFSLMLLRMDPKFLEAYDIPVLAGRNLSMDFANDISTDESESLNVLVNELALPMIGASSPSDAINKRFYLISEEEASVEYTVVGVVPTQNIVGLFNQEKAWMYVYPPDAMEVGSIRISGGNMMETVEAIEDAWARVIPDYPIQGRFLDDVFNDVFNILRYINLALAGFAFIALALALIGLFGLAAFMAAQRTKEIGVRKVLGASSLQIARLLVWQFSTPVMWALVIALPLAWFASNQYLNFFADRISTQIPLLLIAGVVAVLLAWGTIAGHAIRIARANPIMALRYE
ncbi:MAG: FtsX-like permease family protein [Woeseiaceae bacterium]